MKAIRLHRFGGPEVLQLDEIDTPVLQSGEVLVRNRSAGVNPIDWKTRSGGGARPFLGEPPLTLGWECAGTVEQVADDVKQWQPGDRVLGLLNFPEEGGCYAEQVVAKAEQLAAVPEGLPLNLAGGLPLAGLTAWQALFDAADLQPGQTVVITAAAGGVGHVAVQLARWKGARVIGTASKVNHEALRALGCDQVVDYNQQSPAGVIDDADVVVDAVGGQSGIDALGCLKPGGMLVTLPTVTAAEVIEAAQHKGLRASGIRVVGNAGQLGRLAALASDGELKLSVDRGFKLQDAADAQRYSESGHAKGKIILQIG